MIPQPETDPASMTPQQATLHFQGRVQQIQKEQGLDLVGAWAMARGLLPELYARAFWGVAPAEPAKVRQVGSYRDGAQIIAPPTTAQFAGAPARGGRKLSLLPLPNDDTIAALGLPKDVPYDVFEAAARANDGASPRNSKAIWTAILGVPVGKGMSMEAAEAEARLRYPQLFSEINHGGGAGANSDEQEASRKAHLASSLAQDKPGHFAAAAAHDAAADAQSRAGDTEAAEMHRRMASYHTRQANQSKKS